MSTPIGFGIDVSHFQAPLQVKAAAGRVSFVMARASFGAKLKDDRCAEHVQAARQIDAKVGLYHFFRPSHSVADQFRVFCEVSEAAGITEGDICPALDIERDPFDGAGRDVDPAWSDPARELTELLVERFGNCLAYITHREWVGMGSPGWILERPLWTAHYINAAAPSTPGGRQCTIWQHRVGKFDPDGPGGYFDHESPQIDQNRLYLPLPLIPSRGVVSDAEAERIRGLVAETTDEALRDTDRSPPPENAA